MWHRHRVSGAGVAVILAAQCMTPYAQAPSGPERPWLIPQDTEIRLTMQSGNSLAVPQKLYDLPALIDLAQRTNPETRAAWEAAREAAAKIGLIESTFLPQLSVQAIGGFERTPLPAPKSLVPAGYFVSNTREFIPALAMKWLLFDFGQRDARLEAARDESFVANVAFTGVHQKLIFAVSQAYFDLGAAAGRLEAARESLETALISQDATAALRMRGLATVVALAQSQRQLAQAKYVVAQADGAMIIARANLIATLGVPADTELRVADSSEMPLPLIPSEGMSATIRGALARRPDVVAALGMVDAAQASLKAERRSYYPVVEFGAQVFQNLGSLSSDGRPYSSVDKTGANALLSFSVPVFDGGQRSSRIDAAQSKVREAEARLDAIRDVAANQVVKTYNALVTSLTQYQAATEVTQAARTAYDAALNSYREGVGTYTDLATEENAVAQAETQIEDARAAAHDAASGLAFAMGTMQINNNADPSSP